MTEVTRFEHARARLPEVAATVTQIVVDNPGQFALITAGTIVATRAAFNIVRPRNALEAFALMALLQIGLPKLGTMAVDRGWIRFKVRDVHGCLVPFEPEHDAPAPA